MPDCAKCTGEELEQWKGVDSVESRECQLQQSNAARVGGARWTRGGIVGDGIGEEAHGLGVRSRMVFCAPAET